MCKTCGCGKTTLDPQHDHDHHHRPGGHQDHGHPHPEHDHGERTGGSRRAKVVDVQRRVLARNDAIAADNRAWLAERGVVALNLISAPGAGKTRLLERTLDRLRGAVRCAVITGDQQTDNDARRLRGKGAPVRQIETHDACHLDAGMVRDVLRDVVDDGTRLLLIENVGNLVCPAAFDLGENFKVALLSCAEGEDKPVKYPTLFMDARVVVLTKMDLADHLDWDAGLCRAFLRRVQPDVRLFELSAKTGAGLDAWVAYLKELAS